MKWLRTAVPILVCLVISVPASAGDYHVGATLDCTQCHTMHFSQAHPWFAGDTGTVTPELVPLGSGPNAYLLRDSINNLCLACHDANIIAPDVYGPVNGGNAPTDVRLAGFLNRDGDGDEDNGHTLDWIGTAPGGTWQTDPTLGLTCIDCHHQHGYQGPAHPFPGETNYRNLVYNPGVIAFPGLNVTYNDGAWGVDPLNTRDVFETAMASYDESTAFYYEPDITDSTYANWCAGCHENFHGDIGGAEVGGSVASGSFIRHPNEEVNVGDLGGGHSSFGIWTDPLNVNKVKVLSASGNWDGTGAAQDVTPSCMTCHKAHGNGNGFGLVYRDATDPTPTENGSLNGTYVDLCAQCHVQGG